VQHGRVDTGITEHLHARRINRRGFRGQVDRKITNCAIKRVQLSLTIITLNCLQSELNLVFSPTQFFDFIPEVVAMRA